MILSPEDDALLYEVLRPVEGLSESLKGFRDLEDLTRKARRMSELMLRIQVVSRDIEQRTRDAALRRLDDVHA